MARRTLRTIGAAAAMAVAAVAGSTGAQAAPQAPRRTAAPARAALAAKPKVVVVGDSISSDAVAGPQIDAVFDGLMGWDSSRVAIGGQSVAQMRDYIRFLATSHPAAMVIELGTNDMGGVALNAGGVAPSGNQQLVNYANAVAQLEGALADVAGLPCIVWINVNDWSRIDYSPHGQYDLRTWGPVYNDRLVDEISGPGAIPAHPNLHVVDYASQIRAKGLPWMAANYDGLVIHPDTTTGKQTVAAIMATGTRNACGI